MFDSDATTQIKAEIEQLKTDISTEYTAIKNEASTLIQIQTLNGSTYDTRTLHTTYGDYDVGLARHHDFFLALGAPIMFACSVGALFILLGGRRD